MHFSSAGTIVGRAGCQQLPPASPQQSYLNPPAVSQPGPQVCPLSQGVLAEGARGPGQQGALRPALPGAAKPARWVFLPLSLPLPLALSPPGLTSGSGARPPLSVPGLGCSQWRPREEERRPRAAPSSRNFRLPKPHKFAGGAWGGVGGRGSRGGKPEGRGRAEPRGRRLLTHAEPAAARLRAPPQGHASSRPPARRPCPRVRIPRRPPRVAGPAPRWCMRGGAVARPRRRWKA